MVETSKKNFGMMMVSIIMHWNKTPLCMKKQWWIAASLSYEQMHVKLLPLNGDGDFYLKNHFTFEKICRIWRKTQNLNCRVPCYAV